MSSGSVVSLQLFSSYRLQVYFSNPLVQPSDPLVPELCCVSVRCLPTRRRLLLYLKYQPEKNEASSNTVYNPVRSLPVSSSFIQTVNPSGNQAACAWPSVLLPPHPSWTCFPGTFTAPHDRRSLAQGDRCGSLAGPPAVEWTPLNLALAGHTVPCLQAPGSRPSSPPVQRELFSYL